MGVERYMEKYVDMYIGRLWGRKAVIFLSLKKRFGMMKYEMKHMKGFTIFHCFMALIFFRNTDFELFYQIYNSGLS